MIMSECYAEAMQVHGYCMAPVWRPCYVNEAVTRSAG